MVFLLLERDWRLEQLSLAITGYHCAKLSIQFMENSWEWDNKVFVTGLRRWGVRSEGGGRGRVAGASKFAELSHCSGVTRRSDGSYGGEWMHEGRRGISVRCQIISGLSSLSVMYIYLGEREETDSRCCRGKHTKHFTFLLLCWSNKWFDYGILFRMKWSD